MSQTTLDDDELFGEAASEMRADVEEHVDRAMATLPAGGDLWEVEADNVLGVLNGLRSALDAEEARTHLRDARKWYTMGERAGAFDDGDDLAAELAELEELLADVAEARESASDLASTLPAIRSALEEAHGEG